MVDRSRPAPQAPGEALELTRVFDAPRDLVWKVWTEPEHLAQWWGPKYFTNPVCEIDLRPGGALRIDMTDPDGNVYPMTGTFHEIIEPERLVYTGRAFEDENGIAGLETLTTVILAEHEGNKTELKVTAVVLKVDPAMAGALAGMEPGWTESFGKLDEYLATTA